MASDPTDRPVGAIIATDTVYNGASAEEGFRKFPGIAKNAFQPSCTALAKFSWLPLIVSLLTDHYYDPDALDRTLRELYKMGQGLFNLAPTTPASPARSRVSVIASRVSDGQAHVFTNYRGVRPAVADPPYEIVTPQNSNQDPELWEV